MLTPEEFKRLQKLSCIQLDGEQEKKLGNQLVNIVDFLGKLNEIKIDKDIADGTADINIDNGLRVIPGVKDYENTDGLFQNVKHEKINNSVVIKSVIDS